MSQNSASVGGTSLTTSDLKEDAYWKQEHEDCNVGAVKYY